MEWYIWVILGSIAGAIAALTSKKALFQEHALEFSSFRAIITLVLVGLLALAIDLSISLEDALFLFIFATIASLGIILRNHILRHADLSEVTPLDGIGSIFVLLLGIIFLSEVPSIVQFLGILLCVIGVYVLEYDHKSIFQPFKIMFTRPLFRQYFYVFILFAMVSIALRQILQSLSPFTVLFYFMFFVSMQILLVELILHGTKDFKHFRQAPIAIILTAIGMFVANLFTYIALTNPEAQAVLVRTISVGSGIVITFIGGSYFHEKNLLRKVIASMIIIGASILVVL